MGRAGREMSSKRRVEGREGEMVHLGNGQMTGDESERLSANFHASAMRTAGVGGASEGQQGVGLGFKFSNPSQTE